jgi:hypothetical protein
MNTARGRQAMTKQKQHVSRNSNDLRQTRIALPLPTFEKAVDSYPEWNSHSDEITTATESLMSGLVTQLQQSRWLSRVKLATVTQLLVHAL